jgi:hypothetical protein
MGKPRWYGKQLMSGKRYATPLGCYKGRMVYDAYDANGKLIRGFRTAAEAMRAVEERAQPAQPEE